MIRVYIVPVLAIAGMGLAAYTIVQGSKPVVPQPPVVQPPSAPFSTFVAASGIVESSTLNIDVGTPVGGVVDEVLVTVGQDVRKGEALFRIEARELEAERASREAALRVVEAQHRRLEASPRPEEIPPAEARVLEAEASLADAREKLALRQAVTDPRAITVDTLSEARFLVAGAEARLAQARADLSLLKAGTWGVDLDVSRAQVESARAQLRSVETDLERRTIRALVDGRVLQVNIRPGEFAPAGVTSQSLLVLGEVSTLHVRADVDENDAWRVREGSKAVAYVRGNASLSTSLTFVRFEPLVVPKKSLTGESTERVDTRVLQIIFAFDPKSLPVFVGQQVDVYIESAPVSASSGTPGTSEPPKNH